MPSITKPVAIVNMIKIAGIILFPVVALTAISVSRSLHLQLQSNQSQKDIAIITEILKQFGSK